MDTIIRESYLKTLKDFKDKQIIKVVTGVRRCGKSTLLKIFQNYLKENGIPESQIISINFELQENEWLLDRHKLYDYIKSKIVKNKKNYVFLDEIQNVKDFEKTVDSLYLDKNIDLYITGSNAYLLSSEIATLLTGRYIEVKMLPLSFKEYLSAFDDNTDLNKRFNDYLQYSSFPQSIEICETNKDNVYLFLDGIYNTILFKEVMKRNDITDKNLLEKVVRFMYDNIGNRTSINKIANSLEKNTNSSYNTISNYIDALTQSFLIYKAERYDIKGKEYLKTQEKYYAVDIGLRYYMLGQGSGKDLGHIIENIVYLELLRMNYKVYIGKYDNYEIDFVAKTNETTKYYQVSLSLRDEKTLERELRPLEKIKDNYQKYLITMDDDPPASYNGIKKINLLDWLIDKSVE